MGIEQLEQSLEPWVKNKKTVDVTQNGVVLQLNLHGKEFSKKRINLEIGLFQRPQNEELYFVETEKKITKPAPIFNDRNIDSVFRMFNNILFFTYFRTTISTQSS